MQSASRAHEPRPKLGSVRPGGAVGQAPRAPTEGAADADAPAEADADADAVTAADAVTDAGTVTDADADAGTVTDAGAPVEPESRGQPASAMTPNANAPPTIVLWSTTILFYTEATMSSAPSSPELALIVAIAKNGVIGSGGQLPWSWPEDRARYEATTHGHAVVMGRRTWEERGEPLADRINVVVSRALAAGGGLPAGVHVAPDLASALAVAYRYDACPFVIGGVRLFEEAMPRVTRIHLTEIPESPPGDTVFRLDETPFREVAREATASGLVFRVLERLQRPSAVRI